MLTSALPVCGLAYVQRDDPILAAASEAAGLPAADRADRDGPEGVDVPTRPARCLGSKVWTAYAETCGWGW